jgi:hypothetical protein
MSCRGSRRRAGLSARGSIWQAGVQTRGVVVGADGRRDPRAHVAAASEHIAVVGGGFGTGRAIRSGHDRAPWPPTRAGAATPSTRLRSWAANAVALKRPIPLDCTGFGSDSRALLCAAPVGPD